MPYPFHSDVFTQEIKTYVYINICTLMFRTEQLQIATVKKKQQQMSIIKWLTNCGIAIQWNTIWNKKE